MSRRKVQGVALISVLLIVAILMAIAARLMANHSLTINQHQNVFAQNQALQYVLGAETLARQVLVEDFRTGGPEVDHFSELWAQDVLPLDLDEGGYMEAQVRDMSGCFNLNNLAGSRANERLEQFERMLNNLGVQPQIAHAVKDWVDADEVVTKFGAEDSEYLLAGIPHRAPNTLVSNTSELAMMNNITREEYAQIIPHVCFIPDTESVLNVNTAGLHALASLSTKISPASVEAIVTSPREYTEVSDFVKDHADFGDVAGELSVTSQYFQLHAIAQVGDSSATLLTTFHRDPTSGNVTVLGRDFGKLFVSRLVEDT